MINSILTSAGLTQTQWTQSPVTQLSLSICVPANLCGLTCCVRVFFLAYTLTHTYTHTSAHISRKLLTALTIAHAHNLPSLSLIPTAILAGKRHAKRCMPEVFVCHSCRSW